MSNYRAPRAADALLNRAFAAGAAVCVGAVAVTGVFIAKISHSYAASHPAGNSSVTGPTDGGFGAGSGQQNSGSGGGGQLSVAPQNQAPAGGSNGS
jgi:hypothetical protein